MLRRGPVGGVNKGVLLDGSGKLSVLFWLIPSEFSMEKHTKTNGKRI